MEAFTFIVAIIALIVGAAAFVRTGGLGDLRHRFGAASSTTATSTADALARLERRIRGIERAGAEKSAGSTDAA